MNRRVPIAGLAVAVLIVVINALSGDSSTAQAQQMQPPKPTAQPTTQAPTDPLGTAPPGTHGRPGTPPGLPREQIEKEISPEEREVIGLPTPTWLTQGKVHPDVREILKTGQMPWVRFKGWSPIGFEGTAYVAVYLRHEQRGERTSEGNRAAIRETQSHVLSRLTAAEFSIVFRFKDTPGLLGYVSVEGLAKLEKDADVVAVGLDETPLPKEPPLPLHERPPDVVDKNGRKHPPPRPQWIGKVREDVYEALRRNPNSDGYAFVTVTLQRPIEWRLPYDEKEVLMRQMEDRILSTLTPQDFMVRCRGGGALSGLVSTEGLAKLIEHAEVGGVFLEESFKVIH